MVCRSRKGYSYDRFTKIVGFASLAFSVGVSAQSMGPVAGDTENGALLYYQHGCYGCRGYSGYGRQDVAPLLPSTWMPNYPASALPNDQVSDIYAYIRSMPRNEPEVGDIPTLQAILESASRSYSP